MHTRLRCGRFEVAECGTSRVPEGKSESRHHDWPKMEMGMKGLFSLRSSLNQWRFPLRQMANATLVPSFRAKPRTRNYVELHSLGTNAEFERPYRPILRPSSGSSSPGRNHTGELQAAQRECLGQDLYLPSCLEWHLFICRVFFFSRVLMPGYVPLNPTARGSSKLIVLNPAEFLPRPLFTLSIFCHRPSAAGRRTRDWTSQSVVFFWGIHHCIK
jgi:hypothetical protein